MPSFKKRTKNRMEKMAAKEKRIERAKLANLLKERRLFTGKLQAESRNWKPYDGPNWCDLPAEVKSQCIKWMNLKTRCRLRRTAHTEKELVESNKYKNGKFVMFVKKYGRIEVSSDSSAFSSKSKKMQLNAGTLKSFLKMTALEFLAVESSSTASELLLEVSKNTKFEIDSLHMDAISKNEIPFLGACKGLKNVSLSFRKEKNVEFRDLEQVYETLCKMRSFSTTHMQSYEADDIILLIKTFLKANKTASFHITLPFTSTELSQEFEVKFRDMFKDRSPEVSGDAYLGFKQEFKVKIGEKRYIKCTLKNDEFFRNRSTYLEIYDGSRENDYDDFY